MVVVGDLNWDGKSVVGVVREHSLHLLNCVRKIIDILFQKCDSSLILFKLILMSLCLLCIKINHCKKSNEMMEQNAVDLLSKCKGAIKHERHCFGTSNHIHKC